MGSDGHGEAGSGAGPGLGVQEVVVAGSGAGDVTGVDVVVVGLGSVLVVVGVVSELGGVVVVVGVGAAEVEEVVVVDGAIAAVLEFGSVVAPAAPAAATLGVVGWPSTVGSVCVWVRPGSTFGVGLTVGLVIAPAACFAADLSSAFFALAAAFLAGAGLCGCLTAAGRATTEAPPDT